MTSPTHPRSRALLGPHGRKALLSAHVVCSVGWLGAAAAGLALSLVAAATADPALRIGVYQALHSLDGVLLLPAAIAALVSGVLVAVTSRWGLTRHVWVIVKSALAVIATIAFVAFASGAIGDVLATLVAAPDSTVGAGGTQVVVAWLGIVGVLVADVVLSVVKPWGRTGR